MLHLENDGPDLRATNYWQTEHARRGVLRLPLLKQGDSRFPEWPPTLPERRAPPLNIKRRVMVTMSDKATSNAAMLAHSKCFADSRTASVAVLRSPY